MNRKFINGLVKISSSQLRFLGSMNYQRIKRICLICCLMLGSTSCATTSYYLQSINGHVDLLLKRQTISGILASQNTDKLLRDKLEMVLEIRRFASEHLGLPDNGSYSEITHQRSRLCKCAR